MNQPDPATTSPNVTQEADIGSGERTPGQRDTDALIDQIGKAPPPPSPAPAPARPTDNDPATGTQRKNGPT